jgi:hypothetical protein
MKMMLSEFISKLEAGSSHLNIKSTVASLRAVLVAKGDIEIDLDHMCKALGVKL